MRRVNEFDKEELVKWHESHGMPFSNDLMKQVGYIIPGVAAGFMFQSSGNFAWIEGYISNPESSKEIRDRALDNITQEILHDAESLGFDFVVVLTRHPAVEVRAKDWGFSSKGNYTLLTREL